MENRYQKLTAEMEQQVELLLHKFEQLSVENRALRLELDTTKEALDKAHSSLVEYQANYERLQVAKAFGMSEESKKRAHQRIDRLVRDVDNCLKLLNE